MSMVKPVTYWMLCCLLFFTSCEMKKDLFGQGQGGDEEILPENVGLLDLHLVAEREAAVPGTKGEMEEDLSLVTDDFCVSILDSVGQVVKSYDSYTELKKDGDLLLPAGKYTIRAFSGDDPDAGFDTPYYEGDTTCVISAKEVVRIEANCRLANKKIQFDLSDQFFDSFRGDYMIVVDNGTGVLTISSDELRSAYLRNTGVLRFTIYTATYQGEAYTYSCDLSKNEQIQKYNNLYIKLDALDARPDAPVEPSDPDNPGTGEPEGPDEPSEPSEPTDPTDPTEPENPEYPFTAPTIKVDVSLIEKNYVIEVPSEFVEVDTPDKPDVPDTPGGNEPGEEQPAKTEPTVGATLDGKAFDIKTPQTVSESSKVEIQLTAPGGLASLIVDVNIGGDKMTIDVFNLTPMIADILKNTELPKKGVTTTQTFDISTFIELLAEGSNVFVVSMTDEKGQSGGGTITLLK